MAHGGRPATDLQHTFTMMLNFDINIFGWILVVLGLISVLATPLLFGKPREPINFTYWITAIIQYIILLLALGVLG